MVILSIIGFCLSMIGCLLNNRKLLLCWPVFIAADAVFVYLHLSKGFYVYAIRELAFLILCFEGWYRWKYKGDKNDI